MMRLLKKSVHALIVFVLGVVLVLCVVGDIYIGRDVGFFGLRHPIRIIFGVISGLLLIKMGIDYTVKKISDAQKEESK